MLKSVSSITNAIGALNFQGTWDANANSPALASSVGTKGEYYVVGTAGSTALNGISNWGVGDLATFNGSVWQRVEGGADLNGVNLSVSGVATFSAGTVLLPAITTTGDTNTGIFFPAADTIAFAEGGAEAMRLNSSSVMLMGATSARTTEAKIELTSPANTALSLYMFKDTQVEATLGFKGSTDSNFYVGSGSLSVGANGVFLTNTGTAWIAVSDERLKKDITTLDTNRGLSGLLKINPVTFYWKSENSQQSLQIGLIAQNVQANFPDLVNLGPVSEAAPDGAIGVNYTGFIAPLIKAIQELKVIIDSQADRIAELEAKV